MEYKPPQEWSTGLLSCFADCKSCWLTMLCPCVAFGRIAHIADNGLTTCCGSASLCCCLCLMGHFHSFYTCLYRRKLRMQSNLPEKPCCDCCVSYFCECCSLCQMYRELQNRGFDMSKGYRENMERLGQGSMQPPVPGAMMR